MAQQQRFKTTVPLPVLVSKAKFLYEWCQYDKKDLLSVGFDWEIVAVSPVSSSNA